jgi:hypothetical protein
MGSTYNSLKRFGGIEQGMRAAVNEKYQGNFILLYIVAAGWLYVIVLMAASERSVAAGLGTFLFYGVLPLGVVLYLLATPARRRAQRALEAQRLQDAKQGAQHKAQQDASSAAAPDN